MFAREYHKKKSFFDKRYMYYFVILSHNKVVAEYKQAHKRNVKLLWSLGARAELVTRPSLSFQVRICDQASGCYSSMPAQDTAMRGQETNFHQEKKKVLNALSNRKCVKKYRTIGFHFSLEVSSEVQCCHPSMVTE